MSLSIIFGSLHFEPTNYASSVSRERVVIQPSKSTLTGETRSSTKVRVENIITYSFDLLSDSEIETIVGIFENASGITLEVRLIDSNEGLDATVNFYDSALEFETYDFDANRLSMRFRI